VKWRKTTNLDASHAGVKRSQEYLRDNYLAPIGLSEVDAKIGAPRLDGIYVVEEQDIGQPDGPGSSYPMAGMYIPLEIYVQYIMAINRGMDRAQAEHLART